MPDVFISYNREDRETARLVAHGLEAEGFSVWWDAALRAGEYYEEVTEGNLRSAGAVVVLWSKRSAASKWVRAEATVGERSSTLVPALIEECDRPVRFELVQTADLTKWRGDRNDPNWRTFMQDVRMAISKRGAKPQPAAAPVQHAAAAPAAHPAQTPHAGHEVSIETTFWNSIKDGTDRSDFEAYLKRYPNGHFAALAHNRLAALAKAATPPPQKPATAQASPPRPAPAPAQAQRAAPRAAAPPAAAAKKSGGGLLLVGGIAAGVAALGAVAFMIMRSGEKPVAAEPAPAAVEIADVAPTADGEPPSTEPGSDFVDAFGAQDAPPTDEVAAIDIEGAPLDLSAEEGEAAPTAPPATVAVVTPAPTATPAASGKTFRDCESCPLMATLPAGSFVMGSPDSEPGRNAYEGPQRMVNVPTFAIGVYEVTNAEWAACVADGVCKARRADADGKEPVLSVSWRDADGYANWLTRKTGRKYRLPTEAEWEYAARAGSAGAYWWGDRYDASHVSTRQARAVGSADANAFGLHDVIGNAREWVADCYVNNFTKAPTDGTAVTDGDCGLRVIRGGAWTSSPTDMRIANRSRIAANSSAQYMGFRLAAEVK